MAREPLAEQWRAVASTLRIHAANCDRLADEAEQQGNTLRPDVVNLLHRLDGQLGLAVHRGEGADKRWLDEAKELIGEIRKTTKALGSTGAL